MPTPLLGSPGARFTYLHKARHEHAACELRSVGMHATLFHSTATCLLHCWVRQVLVLLTCTRQDTSTLPASSGQWVCMPHCFIALRHAYSTAGFARCSFYLPAQGKTRARCLRAPVSGYACHTVS